MVTYTKSDTVDSLSEEQLELMAKSQADLFLLVVKDATRFFDTHRIRLLLELGCIEAGRRLQGLRSSSTPSGDQWRCFHCNEVFTDAEQAALHFGTTQMQKPACQYDVAALRETETLLRRYQEEDTDLHRQMHGMQAEHNAALRREEEKGYARGLTDAAKYRQPAAIDQNALGLLRKAKVELERIVHKNHGKPLDGKDWATELDGGDWNQNRAFVALQAINTAINQKTQIATGAAQQSFEEWLANEEATNGAMGLSSLERDQMRMAFNAGKAATSHSEDQVIAWQNTGDPHWIKVGCLAPDNENWLPLVRPAANSNQQGSSA